MSQITHHEVLLHLRQLLELMQLGRESLRELEDSTSQWCYELLSMHSDRIERPRIAIFNDMMGLRQRLHREHRNKKEETIAEEGAKAKEGGDLPERLHGSAELGHADYGKPPRGKTFGLTIAQQLARLPGCLTLKKQSLVRGNPGGISSSGLSARSHHWK